MGAGTRADDDRLLDSGVLAQNRLDLARLDANAADLDLVVDSPQEVEAPVRQETDQVPRPVEPAAGDLRERIGHEGPPGLFFVSEIAQPQAATGQMQLAGYPHRNRPAVAVEGQGLDVRDRPPDRHSLLSILADRLADAADARLGRAIEVYQGDFRHQCPESPGSSGVHRLAAHDEST